MNVRETEKVCQNFQSFRSEFEDFEIHFFEIVSEIHRHEDGAEADTRTGLAAVEVDTRIVLIVQEGEVGIENFVAAVGTEMADPVGAQRNAHAQGVIDTADQRDGEPDDHVPWGKRRETENWVECCETMIGVDLKGEHQSHRMMVDARDVGMKAGICRMGRFAGKKQIVELERVVMIVGAET